MKCPQCSDDKSLVKATRTQHGEIARRRECQACGAMFVTRELYDPEFRISKAKGPRPRVNGRKKDNSDIFSAWSKL